MDGGSRADCRFEEDCRRACGRYNSSPEALSSSCTRLSFSGPIASSLPSCASHRSHSRLTRAGCCSRCEESESRWQETLLPLRKYLQQVREAISAEQHAAGLRNLDCALSECKLLTNLSMRSQTSCRTRRPRWVKSN